MRIAVDFALLVADGQAVEIQPVRLAEKPLLDGRVLVQQRQVVLGDGGEVGAAVGRQHLVGRHIWQLDLGIAVRQHIEGVVVVHAALAGSHCRITFWKAWRVKGPLTQRWLMG